MQQLSEWLKYLSILVLFAVFLEMLLPDNRLQRFVRLVMGLCLMMAVLSPLLQYMQEGKHKAGLLGVAVRPAAAASWQESYRQETVEQLKLILGMLPDIKHVEAEVSLAAAPDGQHFQISRIFITASLRSWTKKPDDKGEELPRAQLKQEMTKLIAAFWRTTPQQVEIRLLPAN